MRAGPLQSHSSCGGSPSVPSYPRSMLWNALSAAPLRALPPSGLRRDLPLSYFDAWMPLMRRDTTSTPGAPSHFPPESPCQSLLYSMLQGYNMTCGMHTRGQVAAAACREEACGRHACR